MEKVIVIGLLLLYFFDVLHNGKLTTLTKISCSSRNRERCPNKPFVILLRASHGNCLGAVKA